MDLGFLRPLYESDGPVASVHLDTSRDTTDAEKKIELRWRHLREHLAELGTDKATLDVLEEAIGQGDSRAYGDHGQALYASEGRLLGAHTLAETPRQDRASLLPIPDVLPLAVDRDRSVPYVLVALDRIHAKVFAYTAQPAAKPTVEMENEGYDLQDMESQGRVHPGQRGDAGGRRADTNVSQELWKENTAQVAEMVRQAVRKVDAAAIIVGGDDEAIAYLRDNLGPRQLTIPIRVVAGGRGGADAEERLHEAAEECLRELIREEHAQAFSDYQRKLAHDQAVRGTESVLPMLSEARVETLLLGSDRINEPELWGSYHSPVLVDTSPRNLDDPNAGFKAPASALMLRAAVMSDAGFTELPQTEQSAPPEEDVHPVEACATLRFPK
ncbi:baeRF2 domain-containing protein [Nocardiopsis terrae]